MLGEVKKADTLSLQVARIGFNVFIAALVLLAPAATGAHASRSEQTLVPPPPPIAIDLGGGLSGGGFEYQSMSNTYPGAYSRPGYSYPTYGKIYNGFNTYSASGKSYLDNGTTSASVSALAAAQNSMAQAMRQYNKNFEVDQNSPDALKQRGLCRYSTGDLVGANSDLSKCLTLDPHNKQAAEALLDLWRRQVAANPLSVNGHLGLARTYLQLGDLEAAQSEYKEVVRLDPNNPHLPAARKCVKAALARRAALKCFESAKTLNGVGDYKDAYDKTLEALTYTPNNSQILLLKGQLADKLSYHAEAREAYLAVLAEDPKNQEAAKGLKGVKPNAKGRAPQMQLAAKQSSSPTQPPKAPPFTSSFNKVATDVTTDNTSAVSTVAAAPDDVGSLSRFIDSVRNLAVTEKIQTKQFEKLSQKSLNTMANKSAKAAQPTSAGPEVPILRAQVPLLDTGSSAIEAPAALAADPEMPKLAPPIPQRAASKGVGSSLPFVPLEPAGQAVSLELQKVTPSKAGITLKVLLRNESDHDLAIPAHLKVAVKSPGRPKKFVAVRFYSDTVPAKCFAKGVIRLPESEFSPTTDVFLPSFPLPNNTALGLAHKDLHLTTPLASL